LLELHTMQTNVGEPAPPPDGRQPFFELASLLLRIGSAKGKKGLARRELAVALCAAAIFFAWPLTACSSVLPGEQFDAVRATTPPPPDPALTGPVWQRALRATMFENFMTHEPARLVTTSLLLYDDKNLYVAFICDQDDVPVTATQIVNDVGYGLDDEVTVAIDTSGSNSRTYAFTSTPLGVRYEYSSESSRYQPPWSTVAASTSHGYRVMMTIPLADMRVSSAKTQSWRINFSRRVAASNDLLTWAYDSGSNSYCQNNSQGATIYCDSTRWSILKNIHLSGVAKAPPPYADLYALGSAGRDRNVYETTPVTFTEHAARFIGIDDLTVPFTRTLALVGTLGPDFSNVETDQVTIAPQEFTRQYHEYRPFFAEGSSFLSALPGIGVNGNAYSMFYTPALGVIDQGLKVEGTVGQNALGVLETKGDGYNDQAFGYGIQKSDGTIGLFAQGVAAHHPGIADDTLGIGGQYQNLRSGLEPIVSYEQETGTLVGVPRVGRALNIGSLLNHGPWQTGAIYRDIGPEFAPIDGYTSVNDIRGPQAFAIYNGVGTSRGAIKAYQLSLVGDRFVDRSGEAHQVDLSESASVTLKNLLGISLNNGTSELRTYGQAFPKYAKTGYVPFNQRIIAIHYRDGTPSPTDFSYTFGPFAVLCLGVPNEPLPCASARNSYTAAYTQQFDISTTRTFQGGYGAVIEYAGTIERAFTGTSDSQWLRRISLTRSIGSNGELALSLREISGTGGFAAPGADLAISYHQRFRNQNQFYFEYGSPASYTTLQRFIVKYVYHFGSGGAGT